MQFATAIEAMLQNDKGFITKSITAHIAEYGAFILSDKKDERIKLEKRIKEIYGVRSGIAHGHKKEDFMLNEAFYIAKMIVIEFLKNSELKKIKDMDELKRWVDDKKFS